MTPPIVRAISDLHGRLPHIEDCDLLLIAGDICPDHYVGKEKRYALDDVGAAWQVQWLHTEFRPWLFDLMRRGIEAVGIAGNHDFAFERRRRWVEALKLPWTYLLDETYESLAGPVIYGTPWVPGLPRWAFYASESGCHARSEAIPKGIDILMSHGPPLGYRDLTSPRFGSMNAGDIYLITACERVQPKLLVCGHIHEGHGYERMFGTTVYNVSYVDENYETRPDTPAAVLLPI
jgi:Icc-related predicted phosphoesterase